ncbi:MAG: oxidoreductase [Gemmataceae bacterium]|nr:oxidoreductase [Gemmataceae bacterium]
MNLLSVPWLELAIVVPLVGSLWVSRFGQPVRAFVWGLTFSGVTLACALLAWLSFSSGEQVNPNWSAQFYLLGRSLFAVDGFSALLVGLVALIHFLTALATGRTKMRRFSLSWSLASESIRLATFSCSDPWLLIGLLTADTLPAFAELSNRGRPSRVYALHMGLFVGLLVLGWSCVDPTASRGHQSAWATIPLLAAILIRCGTVPAHCWLTDWFEHASFGNALLFVAPLTGVYAAVRLVLPVVPDWALSSIGVFSLVTAIYAAGMALVQQEARRFFAYLFLSYASLVLVGLELHTAISLTGALALWVSVTLSLGGFGLTLRALEARFGRLSLVDHHGLYDNSPMLAVCFALTGLASVGFPGTLGFVASEMLVEGAIDANLWAGLGVVLAAAINGIAVVRVYFLLFTGARHLSTVSLFVGARERFAVLTLAALILGGGLFPQPGVSSRHRAATDILAHRDRRSEPANPGPRTPVPAEQARATADHPPRP